MRRSHGRRPLRKRRAVTFAGYGSYLNSGRLDLNQRPLRPEHAGTPTQAPKEKQVAPDDAAACTSACTSEAENKPNRADRLEVIADLLADRPAAERREVIAELPPTDRAAIARLLIGRSSQGSRA